MKSSSYKITLLSYSNNKLALALANTEGLKCFNTRTIFLTKYRVIESTRSVPSNSKDFVAFQMSLKIQ